MRTLGIVPARAGSVRVARKNLRLIGGKRLIDRAIDAALGARRLTDVVVTSDDTEVLDIARARDRVAALVRPAELATETSLAIEYVVHALAAMEGTELYDAVAIIQPSSPLTQAADIDATVSLLEATGAESAVTVVELDHAIHPAKLKRLDGDRLVSYFEDEAGRMAQHQLPRLYVRNGSVYVSRRDVVAAGKILGDDCRGHAMPRERSVDINDEFDMQLAEFLLARKTVE